VVIIQLLSQAQPRSGRRKQPNKAASGQARFSFRFPSLEWAASLVLGAAVARNRGPRKERLVKLGSGCWASAMLPCSRFRWFLVSYNSIHPPSLVLGPSFWSWHYGRKCNWSSRHVRPLRGIHRGRRPRRCRLPGCRRGCRRTRPARGGRSCSASAGSCGTCWVVFPLETT
jgi:hypothetical protein